MPTISGADGCRAGWFVVSEDLDTEKISCRIFSTFSEILQQNPAPQIIAIDIPIGLTERGPRECDQVARRLLGPGRASSVFPAPIRDVLNAATYKQACQMRKRAEGKSMSCQSFGIMKKIREVDEILRQNPNLQKKIREVHPEVCFCYMNDKNPMKHGKKTPEGLNERLKLLRQFFGRFPSDALAERNKSHCAEDDILDAFAALWTAERIISGESVQLPPNPPKDRFGLKMEIVA
jgi:predicted RNase H-like nuclease